MKTHPTTLALVAAAALAAGAASSHLTATAAEEPAPQTGWQHLQLTSLSGRDDGTGAKINELGREGWELVSVAHRTSDGTTISTNYFFKRPL